MCEAELKNKTHAHTCRNVTLALSEPLYLRSISLSFCTEMALRAADRSGHKSQITLQIYQTSHFSPSLTKRAVNSSSKQHTLLYILKQQSFRIAHALEVRMRPRVHLMTLLHCPAHCLSHLLTGISEARERDGIGIGIQRRALEKGSSALAQYQTVTVSVSGSAI